MSWERRYKRMWRQDHKKRGLCIDCCKPAESNRIRCQYHLDVQAEMARKRIKTNREKVIK